MGRAWVEATRLGCAAVTPDDLRAMRRAYNRMETAVLADHVGEALNCDEELLIVLYTAGGNPVLLDLVQNLWQRCRAFKLLGADSDGRTRPDEGAWATQQRLLEAVEARDPEAAVAVTRESLESAQRRIHELLGGR